MNSGDKVGCLKLIVEFVIIFFLTIILNKFFGINDRIAMVIAFVIFLIIDEIIAKISGHSFFY